MSGSDRARRFILSLALTGLPDRSQILPYLAPNEATPKFLHGHFYLDFHNLQLLSAKNTIFTRAESKGHIKFINAIKTNGVDH